MSKDSAISSRSIGLDYRGISVTGDFYFASHCFSGNNQEHPRKRTVEEAEVHSFQSPSEYSLKRGMMASIAGINWQGDVLLIPRWHTMNVSTLVREDFLLKAISPLWSCLSVCTGRLINIGRISERAKKAKFPFLLSTTRFCHPKINRRESNIESCYGCTM